MTDSMVFLITVNSIPRLHKNELCRLVSPYIRRQSGSIFLRHMGYACCSYPVDIIVLCWIHVQLCWTFLCQVARAYWLLLCEWRTGGYTISNRLGSIGCRCRRTDHTYATSIGMSDYDPTQMLLSRHSNET